MPTAARRLLDSLAARRFGNRYDQTTGIVRFEKPQILRAPFADVPVGRLRDPHVAYFIHRNSGHQRGDELVCLCELSDANLTRAGARMVYGPRERRP